MIKKYSLIMLMMTVIMVIIMMKCIMNYVGLISLVKSTGRRRSLRAGHRYDTEGHRESRCRDRDRRKRYVQQELVHQFAVDSVRTR